MCIRDRVITAHDSLAVDVARDLGVTYLVRGLRNATDFDYEANMDYFNKGLAPELETVYLIASHEVTPVSVSYTHLLHQQHQYDGVWHQSQ